MIGLTTSQGTDTPGWLVAVRDALITFALVSVPAILFTKPTDWQDFLQFHHVGIPLISGIEMAIISLAVKYGVRTP